MCATRRCCSRPTAPATCSTQACTALYNHRLMASSHAPAQEDVRNASALFQGYCAGDVLRFQILRGRLWVDFRTRRTRQGWFPMKLGIGAPCRDHPETLTHRMAGSIYIWRFVGRLAGVRRRASRAKLPGDGLILPLASVPARRARGGAHSQFLACCRIKMRLNAGPLWYW